MSFIMLTNSKGEDMLINLDYVMHFSSSKKGVVVEFHDGLTFSFDESFDHLSARVLRVGEFGIERRLLCCEKKSVKGVKPSNLFTE